MALKDHGEEPLRKAAEYVPGSSEREAWIRNRLVDDTGTGFGTALNPIFVSGGSSVTEYTEGATDTTITGPAVLAEGPSDTLTPIQVDASKNLKVAVQGTISATVSGVSTEAKQDTMIGHIDGIETSLSAISGFVDGLEGFTDGIETLLTAIDASLNSIEAEDFATETTLSAMSGKFTAAASLADDLATPTTTQVGSFLYGYVQADGNWDRLRQAGDNSDALGVAATGHLQVLAHQMGFNGVSWDRLRSDTTFGLDVDVTRSALPSGAATLAEQQTQTASLSVLDDWDETDRAKVNLIVGNAGVTGNTGTVDAGTQRVTLATDVALPTGTNSIGQVTANAGTNLNTSLLALESGGNLAAAAASLSVLDDWDETNRAAVNTIAGQVGVQGASGTVTALTQRVVLATDVALPAGTNIIGALSANQSVKETRSATGTQTSVGDSASSVTVLASNANRLGATIYNDSSAALYLKCGATASTTSYAVKLFQDDYWEVPYNYTGIIDGIWASDAGGNARVTEFT